MDRIIIAGAGVGGLATGGLLAKRGYDVRLYSDCEPKGYDWTDSLSVSLLESIIGKKIPLTDFCYDDIVAFYTPSERTAISNAEHGKRTTTKMERAKFTEYLLRFAVESGVKTYFDQRILAPLVDGDKVVGIKTDKEEVFGDLIIDACGVDSPLRKNLPERFGIENDYAYGDVFNVYRRMFVRKKIREIPLCPLEIYLLHMGKPGIAWYTTREDEIDVLIGRFKSVTDGDVANTLTAFKKKHDELTDDIKRGENRRYRIPVRRPLNKMMTAGYAAIGDSAYMTLPMNGSGINFTLNASLILVNTIEKASDYTEQSLWSYQYKYVKEYGAFLAGVEVIKNALLGMKPNWVDFLFENKIITEKEMDNEGEMKIPFGELIGKAIRGLKNPAALLSLVKALAKSGKLTKIYKNVPEVYDCEKVRKWQLDITNNLYLMSGEKVTEEK